MQEPQGGNPFESAIICLCQHLMVIPSVIQNNVLDLEYKTSNVTEVGPLIKHQMSQKSALFYIYL